MIVEQFRHTAHLARHPELDMFIPPALEDELLVGYRARISAMNGQMSPRGFNAQLIAETGRPPSEIDPTTALLHLGARAANSSVLAFAGSHSNYRINCMPGGHLEATELDGKLSKAWVSRINSTSTPDLRACRECVIDEQNRHGFSIWHRSHHVPGRYTCPRHGVALHHFWPDDLGANMPNSIMSSGKFANAELLRWINGSPHITRYLDHMAGVVDGCLTIDRRAVTASIRAAMLKSGEPVTSRGWSTIFAAKIVDSFSMRWLKATVLPRARSITDIANGIITPFFHDYFHMSHPVLAVLRSMHI